MILDKSAIPTRPQMTGNRNKVPSMGCVALHKRLRSMGYTLLSGITCCEKRKVLAGEFKWHTCIVQKAGLAEKVWIRREMTSGAWQLRREDPLAAP